MARGGRTPRAGGLVDVSIPTRFAVGQPMTGERPIDLTVGRLVGHQAGQLREPLPAAMVRHGDTARSAVEGQLCGERIERTPATGGAEGRLWQVVI
jgi:hypothetical protein